MPKPKKPEIVEDLEFGLNWTKAFGSVRIPQLQKRLYCARHNRGTVSQFEHRKAIIQALWPNDCSWHYWMDRRLKSVCDHNFVTWMGGGGCMAGDTVLPNPVTGKAPTMKELHDSGECPIVQTLLGPIRAGKVHLKGNEPLYQITTKSGRKFKTSGGHKILTDSGYVHVSDLRIGDTLLAWEQSASSQQESCASHPRSSSDIGQSVHASNALSFPRTIEDFRGYCSDGLNRDGEPLHWPAEDDRSSGTSHTYAPVCIRLSSRLGDPAYESQYIHPLSPGDLLAMLDSFPSDYSLIEERNRHSSSGMPEHDAPLSRSSYIYSEENFPHSTSEESLHGLRDTYLFYDSCVRRQLDQSWDFRIHEDAVESITKTQSEPFYDLTVPLAHHYFAEGAIHHNCGKSADAAAIAIEYWLEAPHETAVIVCSTTAKELRGRIWSQIIRYYMKLPQGVFPEGHGELLDASMMIRWQQGDWVNGIYGTAIQDGPEEQAINNIVGKHTKRVFWILDEMQEVREAIMGAIPNLLKNPESKMLGMGNPSSFTTMLCRYSEPINGWKSIPQFSDEWEIRSNGYLGTGKALFFDGRKNPAILDPEWGKKNTWMTSKEQMEAHLASVGGNENDPSYMCQAIGWPPQMGLESTVLDGAIITTFQCSEKPVWTDGFIQYASLDPAYDGGDEAILQIMRRGVVKEKTESTRAEDVFINGVEVERWMIAGHEQIKVPIDGDSKVPVDYQIVRFVRQECERRGIPSHECAVACAGRGGALKSIFEVEWGPVNGIEEGGSPSDRVVDARGKTAKETYNTRASELCMAIREFALGNGLRNIPSEVQIQACSRLSFNLNGKLCAEPKTATKGLQQAKGTGAKGFKQRIGYSPDHLDAFVIGIEHARQKGATPSFGMASPVKAEEWNQKVKEESEADEYEETDWKDELDYASF